MIKRILIGLVVLSQATSPALAGGCFSKKFFSRKVIHQPVIQHEVCAPQVQQFHYFGAPSPLPNEFQQQIALGTIERQFQRLQDQFAAIESYQRQYAVQSQQAQLVYQQPSAAQLVYQQPPAAQYQPPVQYAPPQQPVYQQPAPQYQPPYSEQYAPPAQHYQPPVAAPPQQQCPTCQPPAQQLPQYPPQYPPQHSYGEQLPAPEQGYPPHQYQQVPPANGYGQPPTNGHGYPPPAAPQHQYHQLPPEQQPPAQYSQSPEEGYVQQPPRQPHGSVIQQSCVKCHIGPDAKGGLDFTQPLTIEQRESALAMAQDRSMPKGGRPLNPAELAQLAAELRISGTASAAGGGQ